MVLLILISALTALAAAAIVATAVTASRDGYRRSPVSGPRTLEP